MKYIYSDRGRSLLAASSAVHRFLYELVTCIQQVLQVREGSLHNIWNKHRLMRPSNWQISYKHGWLPLAAYRCASSCKYVIILWSLRVKLYAMLSAKMSKLSRSSHGLCFMCDKIRCKAAEVTLNLVIDRKLCVLRKQLCLSWQQAPAWTHSCRKHLLQGFAQPWKLETACQDS